MGMMRYFLEVTIGFHVSMNGTNKQKMENGLTKFHIALVLMTNAYPKVTHLEILVNLSFGFQIKSKACKSFRSDTEFEGESVIKSKPKCRHLEATQNLQFCSVAIICRNDELSSTLGGLKIVYISFF